MISVDLAFDRIKEAIKGPLEVVEMNIDDAIGFVLAKECISPISFPPFHQSAMDGYAINDAGQQLEFKVIGELKAGDSAENRTLQVGEACRVFTGSMLPTNTTAVVKQEDVTRNIDTIQLSGTISNQDNIRLCGEQINFGEVAVPKDTLLNPGAIGFLATLGVKNVSVYRKPEIAVIATGNELVSAGSELKSGQIYESNTSTLIAALSTFGFQATTFVVVDNYDLIKEQIEKAILENELVLITGGISVGDYDFVGQILADLKVDEKFYKVKQKPGKPLYFGTKGDTLIFALPGNPAAVLTSFYIYVLRALAGLIGRTTPFLGHRKVQLSTDFEKSARLTLFLKGEVKENQAVVLSAQSSAMLSSFINANCLIRLEEDKSSWKKGELVDAYMIS